MSEFGMTGDGRLEVLAGHAWRDDPAEEEWWQGDCAAGWYPGDEDEYEDPDPAAERYDDQAEYASRLAGLPADVRAGPRLAAEPRTARPDDLAPPSPPQLRNEW